MRIKAVVIWGLVAVFGIALASFMFTYTVRYTESAVVTTFGRAPADAEPKGAGIYFRWPFPFQIVTKYDTRLRIVETTAETQQTADDRPLIVEAYAIWRVSDPMAFFREYSGAGDSSERHFNAADEVVRGRLRAGQSLIGRYTLTDLFPPTGRGGRIPELEQRMLEEMRAEGAGVGERSLADSGIEVVQIGVSRIRLPQEVTQAVIERMQAARNRETETLRSQGQQVAARIRSDAEADRQRILAFARARAAEIRALGDREAAEYLAGMTEEPRLAIFLKNLDMLRDSLANRTTLLLSTDLPGLRLLSPQSIEEIGPDGLPYLGVFERRDAEPTPVSRLEGQGD